MSSIIFDFSDLKAKARLLDGADQSPMLSAALEQLQGQPTSEPITDTAPCELYFAAASDFDGA